MAEGERAFEEIDDFGLGPEICRTVSVLQSFGEWVTSERGPDEPVRRGDVSYFACEGANTFVVGTRNVERVRSEIEFVFRHRVGGVEDQFFDAVDIAIHDGSDGGGNGLHWWLGPGLRRLLRWSGGRGGGCAYGMEKSAREECHACGRNKEQQPRCFLHLNFPRDRVVLPIRRSWTLLRNTSTLLHTA